MKTYVVMISRYAPTDEYMASWGLKCADPPTCDKIPK